MVQIRNVKKIVWVIWNWSLKFIWDLKFMIWHLAYWIPINESCLPV
jgi:hypothetical protein